MLVLPPRLIQNYLTRKNDDISTEFNVRLKEAKLLNSIVASGNEFHDFMVRIFARSFVRLFFRVSVSSFVLSFVSSFVRSLVPSCVR